MLQKKTIWNCKPLKLIQMFFCVSVNDDLSIKITDFSLARDVNSTNLNDKGIRSRLLVKWTAPEGLAEQGQFSEKSDVVCSIHCLANHVGCYWFFGFLVRNK